MQRPQRDQSIRKMKTTKAATTMTTTTTTAAIHHLTSLVSCTRCCLSLLISLLTRAHNWSKHNRSVRFAPFVMKPFCNVGDRVMSRASFGVHGLAYNGRPTDETTVADAFFNFHGLAAFLMPHPCPLPPRIPKSNRHSMDNPPQTKTAPTRAWATPPRMVSAEAPPSTSDKALPVTSAAEVAAAGAGVPTSSPRRSRFRPRRRRRGRTCRATSRSCRRWPGSRCCTNCGKRSSGRTRGRWTGEFFGSFFACFAFFFVCLCR